MRRGGEDAPHHDDVHHDAGDGHDDVLRHQRKVRPHELRDKGEEEHDRLWIKKANCFKGSKGVYTDISKARLG